MLTKPQQYLNDLVEAGMPYFLICKLWYHNCWLLQQYGTPFDPNMQYPIFHHWIPPTERTVGVYNIVHIKKTKKHNILVCNWALKDRTTSNYKHHVSNCLSHWKLKAELLASMNKGLEIATKSNQKHNEPFQLCLIDVLATIYGLCLGFCSKYHKSATAKPHFDI